MKEIEPGATRCSACGTIYGTDTVRLLRRQVGQAEEVSERRHHESIPKKFKISYQNAQSLRNHYLAHPGTGGVFIPSREPFTRGARFDLRIYLPDKAEPLDIYCEVVWSQNQERVINDRAYPPGMGIKFLNLSPEGNDRIHKILRTVSS